MSPKIIKPKYFLDTSVFYECIKMGAGEFETHLVKYAPGRRYAAYYSVMELNARLFYEAVQHYKDVEQMRDVPRALVKLSNKFSPASKARGVIFYSYLLRRSDIPQQYDLYLIHLEAMIMDMNDRLKNLVKDFRGFFQDHDLANLDTYSKADYDELVEACGKYDRKESLKDFWTHATGSVKRMLRALDTEKEDKGKLNKRQQELEKFLKSVDSAGEAIKYNDVADLVIAMECPRNQTLVAKDKIFAVFAPLLDKRQIYWSPL